MRDKYIECPKCRKPVAVEIVPNGPINLETVSMIVVEHTGELMCPCGAVLIPIVLASSQLQFRLMEIPLEKRKRVVMPAGFKIMGQ